MSKCVVMWRLLAFARALFAFAAAATAREERVDETGCELYKCYVKHYAPPPI